MPTNSKLRINQSALDYIEKKFYYNEKLFTGSMFSEDGDDIIALEVIQGELGRAYRNKLLNDVDHNPNGFIKMPEYPIPQAMFKGRAVNGTTFGFEQEFCVKECLYYDGIPLVKMTWYIDGNLKSFERYINNVEAGFKFYQNGEIKSILIEKDKKPDLRIIISEQGELDYLTVSENLSNTLIEIEPSLPFYIPSGNEDFADYVFGDNVTLSGNGIGKELIDLILERNCLAKTSTIIADVLGFKKSQIVKIGRLAKLERLEVKDINGNIADELAQIKQQRPEVNIHYHFLIE